MLVGATRSAKGRPSAARVRTAGDPFDRVRDERQASVGVGLPDDVRRGRHEVAVAGLRLPQLRLRAAQALDQARVGERDAGLPGEGLEALRIVRIERVGDLRLGQQRADRLLGVEDGDRDRRWEPLLLRVAVRARLVDEARIREVVAGDDRPATGDRETADTLVDADAVLGRPWVDPDLGGRVPGPPGLRLGVVGDVDRDALGAEEARTLGGDAMEDRRGLAHHRDVAVDLAQGALGVRALGQLLARTPQLGDEARVRDRDGGDLGEGPEDLAVVLVVFADPPAVDGERADRPVLTEDRGREHRADAALLDPRVEHVRVGEARIVHVVSGPHRPPVAHRLAGDALVGAGVRQLIEREVVQLLAGGRVVAPVEASLALLEQVDPRPVGDEQRDRGLDGPLEDLGRVAERGQGRGELAEGALDLDAPALAHAGVAQLGDELRVVDRARGVIGERPDEDRILLAERMRPRRVDAERAHDPRRAQERRDDHRADAERLDRPIGTGLVRERVVRQVVVGRDDASGLDGLPEHPDPDAKAQAQERRSLLVALEADRERGPQLVRDRRAQVDEPAVRVEQSHGLLERRVEEPPAATSPGERRVVRVDLRGPTAASDGIATVNHGVKDRHRPARSKRAGL